MFLSYSFPLLFGLLLIVYYRLSGNAQGGLLLGFSICCYARAGWESMGLMLLVTALCWCGDYCCHYLMYQYLKPT